MKGLGGPLPTTSTSVAASMWTTCEESPPAHPAVFIDAHVLSEFRVTGGARSPREKVNLNVVH